MAVNKIKEIAVEMIESAGSEDKKIETLRRLAGTAMNSKLIKRNQEFFTKSERPPFFGSPEIFQRASRSIWNCGVLDG